MKIVVAIDSFKGCLSSRELAEAAEAGIRRAMPSAEVVKIPVADGGEGTVDALVEATDGRFRTVVVRGPLGERVEARYGILGDGQTAVIEMATASGLPLVPPELRDPRHTSTFGTGELIADALDLGCRKFIVGIGGSATNDAGTGMLAALGWKFFGNSDGTNGTLGTLEASPKSQESQESPMSHNESCQSATLLSTSDSPLTPCGANLARITRVDASQAHPALCEAKFLIACDVDNPMYGPQGAAFIFARQKGADDTAISELDAGLRNFAEVIVRETGRDVAHTPGAGAAGALGAAFLAFTNADLRPGIEIVLEQLDFDTLVRDADFVVTGEGRFDAQSLRGKTPIGIARAAKKHGVPVIVLAGSVADDAVTAHNEGVTAFFSIMDAPMTLDTAMHPDTAKRLVTKQAEEVFRIASVSRVW